MTYWARPLTHRLRRIFRTRIAVNTTYFAASNLFQAVLTFTTGILIARFMSAEALGIYGLASSIGQISARIADLGVPSILTRMISRNHPDAIRQLHNAAALRIWTSAAALIAVELFALVAGYNRDVHLPLALYVLSTSVGGVRDIAGCVYHGRQSLQRPAVAAALFRLTAFLITCLAIFAALGIETVVASLIAGQLVSYIYLVLGPDREARRIPSKLHWRGIRSVLRESLPLALSGIFAVVSMRGDQVILAQYVTKESLGYYSAAFAVIIGFTLVPGSLSPALYPALARSFHQDRARALKLFLRIQAVNAVLGILFAAGLAITADLIAIVLYGEGFHPVGPVLSILALSLPCIYVSYTNVTLLTSADRQHLTLWTTVITVSVNIASNAILIPLLGIKGAAWATVFSELSLLLSTSLPVSFLVIGQHRQRDQRW